MPTVTSLEEYDFEVKRKAVACVRFSSKMCPACQSYELVWNAVCNDVKYRNKVNFITIDLGNDPNKIGAKYSVSLIPLTIFYKNNKRVFRENIQTRDAICRYLDSLL